MCNELYEPLMKWNFRLCLNDFNLKNITTDLYISTLAAFFLCYHGMNTVKHCECPDEELHNVGLHLINYFPL